MENKLDAQKNIAQLAKIGIGKRIRERRIFLKLTQKEVADFVGTDRVAVSNWENGKNEPARDHLQKLAKILRTGEMWLVYGVESENFDKKSTTDCGAESLEETVFFGIRSRVVPVISWIQAGQWMEIEDTYHPGCSDIQVTGDNVSRCAFALRVVGDSMEPEFREGEIVIVDPEVTVNSGDFVVAKLKDTNGDKGEATLKRFVRDGGRMYLQPLNRDYKIMDMTDKEFCIVGCVVQKAKKYK